MKAIKKALNNHLKRIKIMYGMFFIIYALIIIKKGSKIFC